MKFMTTLTTLMLGLFVTATLLAGEAVTEPVATDAQAAAFRAEMAKLGQTDAQVVRGKDGWLFLPAELRHIGAGVFWGERAAEVSKASKPEWADPLPVIVDFHKQLKAMGVELLVVPVPPKAMVYPDQIISDDLAKQAQPASPCIVRYDATHRAFYAALREQGVEVIDLMPSFLAARQAAEQPLYCKTDTHWAAPAMSLTLQRIVEHLKEREWFKSTIETQRVALESETREVVINGDLRQLAADESIEKETLPLTFVGRKVDGALQPLENNADSPILLLGDSHLLVYHIGGDMHATGAGFADELALRTGIVPDVMGVRGSGATPARINLLRKNNANPEYLKNKKVVIWLFSAREFTETTGWRPVPLTR